MRGTALLSLMVTWLATGGAARGAEVERVDLRDGGAVQGELVERVPGDHVTLKLATGEVRRIEWAAIAAVAPGAGAGEPARRTMPVSVSSDHPGTSLYRVDRLATLITVRGYGTLARIAKVCDAPCQTRLEADPDVSYYADGPDLPASRAFTLADPVRSLTVTGGSTTMLGLGAASILVGGLAVATGGSLWIIGAVQTSDAARTGHSVGPNGHTLTRAGMGTLISGVALVAIGIPLVLLGRTHVTADGGQRLARATRPHLTADGFVF
jgi:hypothetical protein